MIDSAGTRRSCPLPFSKIQQGLVGRHSLNEWLQAPQFGIDLSECAVRHQLKPPTEQARLLALGDLYAPALAEPLGSSCRDDVLPVRSVARIRWPRRSSLPNPVVLRCPVIVEYVLGVEPMKELPVEVRRCRDLVLAQPEQHHRPSEPGAVGTLRVGTPFVCRHTFLQFGGYVVPRSRCRCPHPGHPVAAS